MTAKSTRTPTIDGFRTAVYEFSPADLLPEAPEAPEDAVDPEDPEDKAAEDSAPADDADDADDDAPPKADVVVRRRPARAQSPKRRGRSPLDGKVPETPAAVWAGSLRFRPLEGGARRRSVIGLVLQIVPAVALVAVSVVLTMVWRDNAAMSEDARQRRELAGSAGKVASTFFNWDYQHMEQSFAAKYPLLTKAAADAIRPTAGSLTSYFTTNKVSSVARINGVYPGEIKGADANVMVIINTRVTTAKTVQSNTGATVAISMKRVSGRWLAGNITLLSSGVVSTTDQNGKPLPNGSGSTLPGTVPSPSPTP